MFIHDSQSHICICKQLDILAAKIQTITVIQFNLYHNYYLQQIQIYTNMNIFKLWHHYYILSSKNMDR